MIYRPAEELASRFTTHLSVGSLVQSEIIGLVAYAAVYGKRNYERGGFRAIFPAVLALGLGAVIAFILSRAQ